MGIELRHNIPEGQERRVAEILYKSLQEKLEPIFGSEERAIGFMMRSFNADRVIVAVHEEVVVGVAGLKFNSKDFLDLSFWRLLREYGFGILRLVFHGAIMDGNVAEDELLIDALAVSSEARGQGIGEKIIEEIFTLARFRGFKEVKLYVVDSNPQAKKFYEKVGFVETGYEKLVYPWTKTFGFSGAYEMTHNLT